MPTRDALRVAYVLASSLWAVPAIAQTATGDQSSSAGGLWEQSNLLDDMAGLRPLLGKYGISFGLSETSQVFGNVTGGVHQGADYEGLTEMGLGLDTSKAFGWHGGIFHISALQIHGRNIDTDNLDALQGVSGIEAIDSTRLWEIWYQQAFLGGNFDIKLGEQSIDQEFLISQQSLIFLNFAMGWPALPSLDLYAGGPTYPLSSLGVRLRAHPSDTVTLLGGVFDDNPPGGPFNDDSQVKGASAWGGNFSLRTGALLIAEIQYALNPPPSGGSDAPSGLPGTYKLGFWYDSGPFPSPVKGQGGLSLANPLSNGIPLLLWNNFSIYGVADQTIWQPNPKEARALGVFARVMGAPSDRNLISWSMNGGFTLKAPIRGRDNDTLGIGFGLAHVSSSAAALDKDEAFFTGQPVPVRGTESFIEVTYQAQLTPWWQVQPDLQYIINPGGGLLNPTDPTKQIGNELVLGLSTMITF
ncbi:MAG: carbohydrate porin [Acetobacteraceae bacterium]|nr:carbohydrate porin [Acetobacteraceae bacterium]